MNGMFRLQLKLGSLTPLAKHERSLRHRAMGLVMGMPRTIPAALTIAGSDCSAGAGAQADLKTFQHFRIHGLTAITCVVSETALTVRAVHAVPPAMLEDQLSLMLDSFPLHAAKTGMLFSTAHIETTARVLRNYPQLQLVVDPVMIASTGDPLLEPDAIDAYRELLFPLATLITPNLHEAQALLGKTIAHESELDAAAIELQQKYNTAILLKGGHLDHPECIDALVDANGIQRFSSPRLAVQASHGTGCTLSAAITAQLALGAKLPVAIANAKSYLNETLRQSYSFQSPNGEVIHALNQGTDFERVGSTF
jgi:hydroxymethylpyrimidine/phosphomethylpyrimidine kinase